MQSGLPPEIKHAIARHCSQKAAASLSIIHSSYTEIAEGVLYRGLSVSPSQTSEKMLKSLCGKPARCRFVKSLTVELFDWEEEALSSGINANLLLGLWEQLTHVVDLRIRLGRKDLSQLYTDRFNQVLASNKGAMRLRTLFCNDWMDLSSILRSQSSSKHLGLYASGQRVAIALVHEQRALRIEPPPVFTLRMKGSLPIHKELGIFPSFSSDTDSCLEAIGYLLDEDHSTEFVASSDQISTIKFYCDDLSKLDTMLKKTASIFPNVIQLNFWTKDVCETVSLSFITKSYRRFINLDASEKPQQTPEMGNVLALLPQLREISFNFWDAVNLTNESVSFLAQRKIEGRVGALKAQVEAWGRLCPYLWSVSLHPDGDYDFKKGSGENGEWEREI